MYGADAIGGVVQIFTKRGAGEPRFSAAAGFGSAKALFASEAVSGSAGRLSYAFAASHQQDDGFSATKPGNFSYNADKDGFRKESASGQLAYGFADGHEAGLLFMHSKLDAQYDAGASSFDARSGQTLDNVALFSTHQITPSWRIRLQASLAYDEQTTYANASATGTSSIDTRLTGFSAQSDLAFGPDLFQVLLERRSEDVVSSSTRALSVGRETNSAALSYSLKRGAHLASASARVDDSSQYGSTSTGGFGYGYRITQGLRANASYGTSFRAPTFNELYYPGFGVTTNRPEHGKNAEAGLVFDNGRIEATAVYYRNRMTDLLVSTARCPVEAATHPFGCAYNVNQATMRGWSMGARTHLGAFDLHASADLQDPRDDTTGKQLVRRAKRHADLGVDYTQGALTAGAGVQLSGSRFDDTANRNTLAGYGVVNLHVSYRFAPEWSAEVRWNNVANKQYELARTYATAGSQAYVGIRYAMK
jgi:vitamin B12 transporter